ncbi:hypothetical protein CI109_106904 [Kwoniella shandongensis]|uniref:BTB domain-containing protein n=1 Tax=Kwoniella shandongensis TaxID=1734106 RepID=A0AAJ8LPC0_9TREE
MTIDDKQLKMDPSYDRSDADVTLISSEDVQFRVDSFYLKAASTVLRDMLGNKDLQSSPIHIDAPAEDVKQLLDFMTAPIAPTITDWKQFQRILELANKFDCGGVIDRLRLRSRGFLLERPWSIFCLASHWNDMSLARSSIERMAVDENVAKLTSKKVPMPLSLASNCSFPYLLGFLSSVRVNELNCYVNDPYSGSTALIDWRKTGMDFTPAS